jgi:hypothetical protein
MLRRCAEPNADRSGKLGHLQILEANCASRLNTARDDEQGHLAVPAEKTPVRPDGASFSIRVVALQVSRTLPPWDRPQNPLTTLFENSSSRILQAH